MLPPSKSDVELNDTGVCAWETKNGIFMRYLLGRDIPGMRS